MKHTPAPWEIQHTNITIARDQKGRACYSYNFRILRMEHTSNLQMKYDVALMSKAPEMYKLLSDINNYNLLKGEYGEHVKKLLEKLV